MESNARVRSLALLALVLGALACTDDYSTAPRLTKAQLRRSVARGSRRPTFFSNSVKYSDKGKKNARAFAGVASLEARALLGADSRTTLDVSTGSIEAPGPGVMDKLQLKLYAANGALQTTTNYNGLASPQFQTVLLGRARGTRVQVLANVSGIQTSRTDIVTVNETVKLRPDLSVDRINVPARSRTSMPVNISALVTENNGDIGARADCVLAVDGVEVDRAHGIWVDAGRSVSCFFSPVFATPGTKQLTVSAVSVNPGDWSSANNTASGTIEIVQANDFNWQAFYISQRNWSGTSFIQGYYTAPQFGNRADFSEYQDVHHIDSWVASVGGNVPAMNGALTYSFHDEMDGTALNDLEFNPETDLPWTYESSYEDPVIGTVQAHTTCTQTYKLVPGVFEGRDIMNSPAWITVCTSFRTGPAGPLPDQSFTDFNFSSGAADVSYYGETYQSYTPGPFEDQEAGYTYTFNGETNYTYGPLVFGNDYSFNVTITGSDGTRTAFGTIHLPPSHVEVVSSQLACYDQGDDTFFSHVCVANNYSVTVVQAQASGTPN